MKKLSVFICALACLFTFKACEDPDDNNGDGISAALPGNVVTSIYTTEDGLVYFATDKGLASFDGTDWTVYHDNPKLLTGIINDMDFEQTSYGPEFWLATNSGLNVASLPIDATSGATLYASDNLPGLFPGQSVLANDTVTTVKVDDNQIRWIATTQGLTAFSGNQWPGINYNSHYHDRFFSQNRITSFDYNNDTVYIGTMGGGVARMIASSPDAISGASPFEVPWSNIPSPNITAVFIDGNSQWYGSDEGLGRHDGIQAKENWHIFTETHGLINKYVQVINKDSEGNIWVGTRGGISVYNGTEFTNYTAADGLVGNDVLSIASGQNGDIWIGTRNGVSVFDGNSFTNYQATD